MRAHEGDTIVVHGRHVGETRRTGRVTEVLAGAGSEHYRVRWESGSETIFFPQADCTVVEDDTVREPTPARARSVTRTEPASGAATPDATASPTAARRPLGPIGLLGPIVDTDVEPANGRHGPAPEPDRAIRRGRAGDRGHIDVWFDHAGTRTDSRVTIQLNGFEVTGFGEAKRNPHDPEQAIVGEELAAARALCDLAHQLLDLATYQIEKREGHQVTLIL